jgi:hypothetical protein
MNIFGSFLLKLKLNQILNFIPRAFLVLLVAVLPDLFVVNSIWAEFYNPTGWLKTPRLVVYKSRQILELHEHGRKKTYRVCLGLNPEGPKRRTGDKRTPEGNYYICLKNVVSNFHRFLGISYPGEEDAQYAFEHGKISLNTRDRIINSVKAKKRPPWDTKLGGWVGLHGYPTLFYPKTWIVLLCPKPHNWTDGCIAMWDFEIEELYSKVPVGTPITILP